MQEFIWDDDVRLPENPLTVEDFLACVEAAAPLWKELALLGWVDDFGGLEFKRVFPAALDFIHEQANRLPQTPESARAVSQDETVASPEEDDVVPVGDVE